MPGSAYRSVTKGFVCLSFAVVALVLLVAVVSRRSAAPDVLYKNRPVSAWALDLNSPVADTREAAAEVIRTMGSNEIPSLVRLLATPDSVFSRVGRLAEGRLPRRLNQVVFRWLRPREAAGRRAAAAQALRIMGENARAALPALARALHSDGTASWHAALTLAQLGRPGITQLIEALRSHDARVRSYACHALGTCGPGASNAVPALIKLLRDPQAGEQSMRTLTSIGNPAVPALIQALGCRDRPTRLLAVRALGALGPRARESMPALIDLLSQDEAEERKAAAEALASIRPAAKPVVLALAELLDDSNSEVRLQAIAGLARSPQTSASAVPALLERLHDSSPLVRSSAAALLGEIGEAKETVVPGLIELLQDGNEIVRAQARQALERYGEERR